jgi:hypothetical protein
MKKIPVGAAIAHAYRFAFGGFPALVRLAWLPVALTMLLNVALAPQMAALSRGITTRDFSGVTMHWWLLVPLYIVAMIAAFMQISAILQYAMDRPEAARHRWFYFSLGRPLWRMIGSLLLLLLTMAALAVVYVLAVIAIGLLFGLGFRLAHMSDSAIRTVAGLDVILAFIVGYCGGIYCAMRFGFLLFPATIALDRVALFQSWLTSHRNFWRMFGISLAVFLPLLAPMLLAFYLLGAFPHVPAGSSPAEIQALQNAASAAMFARLQHYWYFYYPANAILTILIAGLAAGAQSFAWRALQDGDAMPNPP